MGLFFFITYFPRAQVLSCANSECRPLLARAGTAAVVAWVYLDEQKIPVDPPPRRPCQDRTARWGEHGCMPVGLPTWNICAPLTRVLWIILSWIELYTVVYACLMNFLLCCVVLHPSWWFGKSELHVATAEPSSGSSRPCRVASVRTYKYCKNIFTTIPDEKLLNLILLIIA